MKRSMQFLLIGAAAASFGAMCVAHPGHAPISPPEVSFTAPRAIPFELFRGQRIFLTGTVNGHATPIMLETGAGMTTIDQAFATQLGLSGGTTIQVRGAGGDVPGKIVSGVSIAAGSLRLNNLTVLVLDLASIERATGRVIPVLLGSEAFKAAAVTVDFPNNRLLFSDRSKFTPPQGATRIELGERQRVPTLDVSIAGLPPVTADLDLGNPGTLIIGNSYWKDQPQLSSLPHAEWQSGGLGGMKIARQAIIPNVEFGGRRFSGVPAMLNQDPAALPLDGANVGVGMFRPFKVTFDFAGKALYLNGPAEISALPRDRAGVQLELAKDRLKAVYVSPTGPAAAAGLKTGDEIVAVDGRPVNPHYYDTADWTRAAAGRTVTLARADGSNVRVTLANYY
jgi:hypothetical protein